MQTSATSGDWESCLESSFVYKVTNSQDLVSVVECGRFTWKFHDGNCGPVLMLQFWEEEHQQLTGPFCGLWIGSTVFLANFAALQLIRSRKNGFGRPLSLSLTQFPR